VKLRNPWLIRLVGLFGAWLFRLWMGTLRYRIAFSDGTAHPTDPRTTRHLYTSWHESLLVAASWKTRAHTLISHHADGELIAQVCRHLRIGVVRGSSTRGAGEALLRLWRQSRRTHLALTPDGPRGPRRRVKRGLAFLASCTGLPVVGFGVGYSRAWRFPSWDRFALPWPWSTVYCVFSRAVHVPPGLEGPDLDRYRQLIEEQLLQATLAAEQWAGQGSEVRSQSGVFADS
jgi:lysophospholipid acyltransferase (LPLAT)-like uncharacterized protein